MYSDPFFEAARQTIWSLFTAPDTSRARLNQLLEGDAGRFATHQVEGIVLMALGDAAAGRAAFANAAALAEPDEQEFVFTADVLTGQERLPMRLEPLAPNLWSAESVYDILPGGPLKFPERMSVIRLASGGLVLVNPIRLTDELARALEALGPVASVVTNTGFHYFFIADYVRRYPAAQLFGPGLHRTKPEVRALPYAGYLDDKAPIHPGEIDQIHFAGHAFDETALYHRASRSLILTDLATNGAEPASRFCNFYCWLWGQHRRFGCLAYHPWMVRDKVQVEEALGRALDTGLTRLVLAHGPPVESDARKALRAAWQSVLACC